MKQEIIELRYSNTNTYLIKSRRGTLLFDTGWAGTFPKFCAALGEKKLCAQDIGVIIISHFHPDHMGIAQEIAELGGRIAVADVQRGFVHCSDEILMRDGKGFKPIVDQDVLTYSIADSRAFLKDRGIEGELFHTPGHTRDSISLWLERERALFVGDLNPLYELEAHSGTEIAESWKRLLALKPRRVYYGHAKSADLRRDDPKPAPETDIYALVRKIMRLIDKGCTAQVIREKTGADPVFIEDVTRMYLTHQNVGVQGILDRIEIKGK